MYLPKSPGLSRLTGNMEDTASGLVGSKALVKLDLVIREDR